MIDEMSRQGMPDMIPVLSRGKHRSPRSGACFMEYASLLAGERWSDHPECTHPLLAGVARDVNDHISDVGRGRLVPLIPSVIGLKGDDPRIDLAIATRCAIIALPVAAEFRQRALAAGLHAALRVLEEFDQGPAHPGAGMRADISEALQLTPQAATWAEIYVADAPMSTKVFVHRSAPAIVHVAVEGIAEACIPDPDGLLHHLLASVIDDCLSSIDHEPSMVETRLSHSGATIV